MAFSALLCDLDGTLWDSYPAYARALCDGDRSEARVLRDHLAAGTSIVSLMRDRHVSKTMLLRGLRGEQAPALFPGVRNVLRRLSTDGIPIGAVTSLPGWLALHLVEETQLPISLSCVVHAGSCRQRKPSPEPVRLALRTLRVRASVEALYVGDSEADLDAATAAGVPFVCARWGYGAARLRDDVPRIATFSEVAHL